VQGQQLLARPLVLHQHHGRKIDVNIVDPSADIAQHIVMGLFGNQPDRTVFVYDGKMLGIIDDRHIALGESHL